MTELITIKELNDLNKGGDTIVPDTVDLYQLDWHKIVYMRLTEDFIVKFRRFINWEVFFYYGPKENRQLSEEACMTICDDMEDSFNIGSFSIICDVSEKFIRRYINRLDYYDITSVASDSNKTSEQFLIDYADEFDWSQVCSERQLSEDIMRKFKDTHIEWADVSRHQKLSEEFIAEMCHYIHWDELPQRLILSDDFILKYINKFDVKNLAKFYLSVPQVAERYQQLIEAEVSEDIQEIITMRQKRVFDKFTKHELLLAYTAYRTDKIVGLSVDNKIVSLDDEYIRIEHVYENESFIKFLYRIYNMREQCIDCQAHNNNPELDGLSQMESFLKDVEKYS